MLHLMIHSFTHFQTINIRPDLQGLLILETRASLLVTKGIYLVATLGLQHAPTIRILRRWLDPPGTHPNHLRNGGGWSPTEVAPRQPSLSGAKPAGRAPAGDVGSCPTT